MNNAEEDNVFPALERQDIPSFQSIIFSFSFVCSGNPLKKILILLSLRKRNFFPRFEPREKCGPSNECLM